MFENVLKEGKIGNLKVKNRFVMPAMSSGHSGNGGKAGESIIEYYAARARGGFGLLITEFVCISPEGQALPGQMMLYSDDNIPGFKDLADRVHKEGGKIFMQIHHAGRQTASAITGMQPVAPSAIPCPVNMEIPKALTTEEVYELIEKFGDTAGRAKKAGFDGVEIHGAHGYLVAQFLSSYSNRRTDEFGGDIFGRAKIGVDIIKKVKERCGADFPVSFRLSGEELVESGRKIKETVIIAKLLEEAGADLIDVSTAVYASMQYMIAPANVPNGFNLYAAEAVKKEVNIPVVAVGRINDPLMADDVVSGKIADFVALGRASIADPEFPNKVMENRINEISPCVGCVTRCLGTPGLDPADLGVSCMINPFSGHETTMKITKTESPKSVVVVGGGPGGLEAAWVSAARGHKVTLLEKSGEVGGQIISGCVPPWKHELAKAVKYYIEMCKKYGVTIELGVDATPEKILSYSPDEVILATGGTPIYPPIKNEGIPVVQAVDILSSKVVAGKNVLIVGGGMVGLETSEYLLTQNRRSTVVEMLDTVGEGLNPSIQYFVFKALREGGVEILKSTKVEKFTKDGAVCVNASGEIILSGFDMVILAVGSKASNPLEAELKNKVKSLHVIGDAVKTRRIIDAVEEAAKLALTI
jgi:2,4-dienoyl-CoA reductase-like NADH-dependent reductase (Old Yellow Enzyme family)/thioredoxin reductase